jgi:26S proteasome regulatory subunit N1
MVLRLTRFLHAHRFLLDGPGIGGILAVLHAFLDIKGTILDKLHYLLYFLTPAINPRYLCLVGAEDGKLVKGSVRVGMAVETVGQAGRPKTISGFQVGLFLSTLTACLDCWVGILRLG